MLTRLITGLALALLRIPLAHRISGLTRALPHSTLLFLAKPKPRDLNLRDRNRDKILALASDHLAMGDVLLQILRAHLGPVNRTLCVHRDAFRGQLEGDRQRQQPGKGRGEHQQRQRDEHMKFQAAEKREEARRPGRRCPRCNRS